MKNEALRSVLIGLFIFNLISFSPGSDSEIAVLTIPLIPTGNELEGTPIVRESLRLRVNGIPRNIHDLKKIEKSLYGIQDMGRDIVLSFMTSKAGDKLLRGISYFVTEVLRKEDSLIILTPMKAYTMKPGNKERVIAGIGKILKRDCKRFCHQKALFEKRIMSELQKIGTIMSSGRSFYNNSRYTKVLFRFLNSFPEELDQYLKLTLMRNFEKFEGITNRIFAGENEKWWIHFSNDDSHKVIDGVKRILRLIESSCPEKSMKCSGNKKKNPVLHVEAASRSESGSSETNSKVTYWRFIKEIRKALDFRESMIVKDIGSRIRRAGICFNSINFSPRDITGDGMGQSPNTATKAVFSNLTTRTGGKILFENNIECALKEITRHRITLYHLAFPLLKKDNRITIDLDDKYSVLKGYSYPKTLPADFVGKIRQSLARGKCRINDLKVSGNRISFCVTGFEKNMKKTGLLKVGITICSKDGRCIYNKKNTFLSNPGAEKIQLSIGIPKTINGNCSLKVYAIDLNAKISSSSETVVRL